MTVGSLGRNEATAAFLHGTARGEFLLRRCRRCRTASEPHAQLCRACASAELDEQQAGGGARVVSWCVPHGRPHGGETTPRQVLVIAELDEGPWWWGQVVDADPAEIAEGTRLRIDFQRAGDDDEYVPVFRTV